jgi:hypothetical protein
MCSVSDDDEDESVASDECMDTDVGSDADEEANDSTLKEAMARENEGFEVVHDMTIIGDEGNNVDIEEEVGYKPHSEHDSEEAFVEIEAFHLSLN